MKIPLIAVSSTLLFWCEFAYAQDNPNTWPVSEDAVVAAPQNHEVLYEDENIRLLSVTVKAGEREPMHHHKMPSVIMIDSLPRAIDHASDGSQVPSERPPPSAPVPLVIVTGPQPTHAVENTDTIPLHLYRLEYKNLEFRNLIDIAEQIETKMR